MTRGVRINDLSGPELEMSEWRVRGRECEVEVTEFIPYIGLNAKDLLPPTQYL